MKRVLVSLMSAALLAGCATTGPGEPEIEDTVYTGFSERADGTMSQDMRGLICPAKIDELILSRAELIGSDGRDAFCNYNSDDGRIYTVYLSDFPDYSTEDYFRFSMRDTGTVMEQSGYEIDDELSETCELSSLDAATLLRGFANMEGNSIQIGQDPATVFVGSGKLSILTVSTVQPGQYLKFRYTLAGSGEADTETACDFLRDRSLIHQKEIKAATGNESSDDEKMWELIESLSGEKE